MDDANWIEADWSVPAGIHAGTTLRSGGLSQGSFDSFNLAAHVGDHQANVISNRIRLAHMLTLPQQPVWLNQQHGTRVINIDDLPESPVADASVTTKSGIVCTVLTADCLPVLLCDQQGRQIAAVHAGWRGLLNGIIERTVAKFSSQQLVAWLGPAISQQAFAVGKEVRDAFVQHASQSDCAFIKGRAGEWYADLYLLATLRLQTVGLTDISGGRFCTYHEQNYFYSYRRANQTGRMASLIWKE